MQSFSSSLLSLFVCFFRMKNQANNDTEQDRAAHRSANTYGLKSKRSAPPVTELRAFEDDVARLIENVKFRDVNNEFMKELEGGKK